MALEMIKASKKKKIIILSDSLSALEAISSRNLNHSKLLDFFTTYTKVKNRNGDIVLAWVPGHVGIWGNELADSAAKEAIADNLSSSYIPFTDLKQKIRSYTNTQWQEEWNMKEKTNCLKSDPICQRNCPHQEEVAKTMWCLLA